MKFCSSCGSELFDDAVVCTKCGRLVANHEYAFGAPKPQKRQDANEESAIVSVFHFISTIFIALTLFFLLLAVFYCYIYVETSSGYYGSYSYAHWYWDESAMWIAIFTSGLAFASGLTTFILSLAKRQRGSKLFAGISKLIFGVLLVVLSIIAIGA